jgi:hypothetical protein
MKKALVVYQGWVQQIVEPGLDYEIYEGPDATVVWVDAPDEITLDWTLEWSPSQGKMIWIERDAPFTDLSVARKVAYGDVGAQLDMLYHELETTGNISAEGDWYNHIQTVKSVIPKPPPPEIPLTMEEMLAKSLTEEPSKTKRNQPATLEMPAWKRYPGWKGYGIN